MLMMSCTRRRKTDASAGILFSLSVQLFFVFFFTSEHKNESSKSCCVTKIFVPFGVHIQSGWANTGLNALQGILKVFHLDVTHL